MLDLSNIVYNSLLKLNNMTQYTKEKSLIKELDKVLYATYTLSWVVHLLKERYGNISEAKELNVAIAELKEFLGHNGHNDEKGLNFAEASTFYLKSHDLIKSQETAFNSLKWAHWERDRKTANANLRIIDLRMKVGHNNSCIKESNVYCSKCKYIIKQHECHNAMNISYECQTCYDSSFGPNKFYKILEEDTPPYAYGNAWSLPKNGQYGEWLPIIKGPLLHEKNGYHLCNGIDGFRDWISKLYNFDLGKGMRVFEAEFTGESIMCSGERIVRSCRLIKETKWSDKTSDKLAKRCLMSSNSDEHNKILYEYLENGNILGVFND